MLRSLWKILFCFLGSSFLAKACFQIIGTSFTSHLSHFNAQIPQQDGCASKLWLIFYDKNLLPAPGFKLTTFRIMFSCKGIHSLLNRVFVNLQLITLPLLVASCLVYKNHHSLTDNITQSLYVQQSRCLTSFFFGAIF